MEIYTTIIVGLCMLAYTIYGVWKITQFHNTVSGVLGTAGIAAGGCLIYYVIAPFIAALLLWVLKILAIAAVIALVLYILGS